MYSGLARAGALALEPLTRALTDVSACTALLEELGYRVGVTRDAHERIAELLPVGPTLESVASLAESLDEGQPDPTAVAELVESLSEIVAAVADLRELDESTLADLPGVLARPQAWADIAGALPDHLLARYLAAERPAVMFPLRLLGICSSEGPADAARYRFNWQALGSALGDPLSAVKGAVSWDTQFRAWPLQRELGMTLSRFGLPVTVRQRQSAVAEAVAGEPVESPTGFQSDVILFDGETPDGDGVELGLVLVCTTDGNGMIYVGNIASGALDASLAFDETWSLTAAGAFDGTATIGVRIEPSGLTLVGGETTLGASIAFEGAPESPWILVGTADGTRVELDGARIEVGVTGDADEPEAYALARVADGAFRFVLDLGVADSFLRGVLGGAPLAITAGGELRFGTTTGLRFSGGVGLEITLVIDKDVGPLHADSLAIALGPGESGARFAASAVGGFTLGPFSATVDGIGAALEVITGGDGLAGLGAELSFVPPHRVVFAIESEVVNGGGFVDIDLLLGRYAGGLALDAFGVGISAIVVVDTRLPGNPDGWALFASLGATFPTPIQLGFGFTLIGVGGLLALNRTIDVDELASALRTGAADSILFPEDIEEDADAVLAGLDLWFPTKEGTTVVGPVAEIGWGSPTVISAQLGVVVAIPDLIITLLGSVEMLLPTPDEAVLTLRMDIVGAVDIPGSTVIVAASLHDSNLLEVFELSGDMGFYARLAEQPLFVLSVGGYHPQFDPPGALPSWLLELRRISASVSLGEGVEVVLTSYVAVTSNSFQFGGRVKMTASVEVLLTTYTAEGWFGVNLLLVLTPFKIVARATAGVSISAGDRELFGVHLSTRIEGPQPWYATGHASFTFFGFDVDFQFDVGSQPGGEPRDEHDVATDVTTAMTPPTGWEAADPGDSWASGVVTTSELPAGLWVRPDQVVDVRQSVAPLNRTITAFGEFIPETTRIDAANVTLGGEPVASPEWLDDWFAPAQFDRLDDATRLSSPSYELMTAGVRFGDAGVAITENFDECTSVSRDPEESIWPDTETNLSLFVSPTRSIVRPPTSRTVAGEKLVLGTTTYTVARRTDGERAGAALAEAGLGLTLSYAEATSVIEKRAAGDPGERRRLRVVPAYAAVGADAA